MKEVMYLLVPFEEVKDIFPYARVVQGKALLQLAQIRYLKGVTGIEVIGGHEADIMIAEQEEMERNGLTDGGEAAAGQEEVSVGDTGQNEGGGEEPAAEPAEAAPEEPDPEPAEESAPAESESEPAPEESEPGPEGEQPSEEASEGESEDESEGESDGSSENEEEVQTNNKEDEE